MSRMRMMPENGTVSRWDIGRSYSTAPALPVEWPPMSRHYRAGDSVEDFCRACKTDRMHTVMAADPEGAPIRVVCGYCDSEHNYRGGPRIGGSGEPAVPRPSSAGSSGGAPRRDRDRDPFPIVSERERMAPPMSGEQDMEMLLRRIIREEAGVS